MQHTVAHRAERTEGSEGSSGASARLPARFDDVEQLDDFLSRPNQALVDDLARLDGDILILGVAGKMGPTLARLARNASPDKRIIGVARFSEPSLRERLEGFGVETIAADLLDKQQVEALPHAKNVIFMAGVDRCISELRDRRLTPVLDATAAGADVYRKQGFLPQFGFDRWEGTIGGSAESTPEDARLALDRLVRLDASAVGAGRASLLREFLGRRGTRAVVAEGGDGFAMIRRGRRALQVGPVVAASEAGALALIETLFATVRGVGFIDVPSVWKRIGNWLAGSGFAIQRSFTRMALGRAEPFGAPQRLFAVAGPEFG